MRHAEGSVLRRQRRYLRRGALRVRLLGLARHDLDALRRRGPGRDRSTVALWDEVERHTLDEAGKRQREARSADDRDRKRYGNEQGSGESPLQRPVGFTPGQPFGHKVRAHDHRVAIQKAPASPDRVLACAAKGGGDRAGDSGVGSYSSALGAARARWPNRSSKPVRCGNPTLARFDSGAAPSRRNTCK